MGARQARWAAALTLAMLAGPAGAQHDGGTDAPQARPLGGDRYQIGTIVVDKAARRFSVPGTILDLGSPGAPLEFVAGTRDGIKLYETLVKLDTDAVAFNVACILIGLDAARGRAADHHFDPAPVAGMPVAVHVEWTAHGETVRRSAAELIRTEGGGAATDEWVYTGSMLSDDGRFMAAEHGVLVGFVHAPEPLIEHRTGIGLGDYGAASSNPDTVPPPGTPITLTVSALPAP